MSSDELEESGSLPETVDDHIDQDSQHSPAPQQPPPSDNDVPNISTDPKIEIEAILRRADSVMNPKSRQPSSTRSRISWTLPSCPQPSYLCLSLFRFLLFLLILFIYFVCQAAKGTVADAIKLVSKAKMKGTPLCRPRTPSLSLLLPHYHFLIILYLGFLVDEVSSALKWAQDARWPIHQPAHPRQVRPQARRRHSFSIQRTLPFLFSFFSSYLFFPFIYITDWLIFCLGSASLAEFALPDGLNRELEVCLWKLPAVILFFLFNFLLLNFISHDQEALEKLLPDFVVPLSPFYFLTL